MSARTIIARFLSLVSIFVGLSLLPHETQAAQAHTDFSSIRQPNGIVFQGRVMGDEWVKWIETKEGYRIAQAGDGFWYYADTWAMKGPLQSPAQEEALQLTTIPAHFPPPQGLKPFDPSEPSKSFQMALRAEASAYIPPTGTFKGNLLFILVQFNDKKEQYSPSNWSSESPGTLFSTVNYFKKASLGLVSLSPCHETSGSDDGVIGWINVSARLKELETETGAMETSGNHPNTGLRNGARYLFLNRLLAKASILEADRFVDFSKYDTNGDGEITPDELAIQIVVAGYDAAAANPPADGKSVWAHSWTIPSSSIGLPQVDGKKISHYSMVGEMHNSNRQKHRATFGVSAHEFGHQIFNWIDLYNTVTQKPGIGPWCLMGTGNWGRMAGQTFIGATPVLPCAYTKLVSKWTTPVVAGTATWPAGKLNSAGSTDATARNTTIIARNPSQGRQYFLLEARGDIGYDKGLEAYLSSNWKTGIAIWHIDETIASNNNDLHRRVDLEAANGANGLRDADTFSSQAVLWRKNDFFWRLSTPSSRLYSGTPTRWVVFNIETLGQVSKVSVAKDVGVSVEIDPEQAVVEGAQWRVSSASGSVYSEWLDSGAEEIYWFPGQWAIQFSSIPDWNSPPQEAVDLVPLGKLAITRTYTQDPQFKTIEFGQESSIIVKFQGGNKTISLEGKGSLEARNATLKSDTTSQVDEYHVAQEKVAANFQAVTGDMTRVQYVVAASMDGQAPPWNWENSDDYSRYVWSANPSYVASWLMKDEDGFGRWHSMESVDGAMEFEHDVFDPACTVTSPVLDAFVNIDLYYTLDVYDIETGELTRSYSGHYDWDSFLDLAAGPCL